MFDQFFLIDEATVKKLVETALVEKADCVLEIGAGTGIVTKEIAKKAGKVIAIEIDRRFENDLKKLPSNVEVIFGDALEIFDKKKKFSKIISSLPSSLVEPLAYLLAKINFKVASVLVPLKFVDKITKDWVLTAYLQSELICKVNKKSFSPQPKTNWALIKIERKPNPFEVLDYERFFRQYIYEHPNAKLKNSLMEAFIRVYTSQGKKITKNQAREIVRKMKVDPEELENLPEETNNISSIFEKIKIIPS